MFRRRNLILLSLASLLIFTLLGLLFISQQTKETKLIVHSSAGGSVDLSSDVLLPGEPIETLQRVKVIRGQLKIGYADGQVRMALNEDSQVLFERIYTDTPIVRIRLESGGGTIDVRSGRASLYIQDRQVVVNRGGLRWDLGRNRPFLIDKRFQGRVNKSGGNKIGNDDGVRRSESSIKLSFQPMKPKEQWYVGSLIPGVEVKKRVKTYHQKKGKVPKSLKSVYGYWIRDREGNVFLYNYSGNRFSVVSAGRDQQMFTTDDRQWSGQFNF